LFSISEAFMAKFRIHPNDGGDALRRLVSMVNRFAYDSRKPKQRSEKETRRVIEDDEE
jgi:hypothetical protein